MSKYCTVNLQKMECTFVVSKFRHLAHLKLTKLAHNQFDFLLILNDRVNQKAIFLSFIKSFPKLI